MRDLLVDANFPRTRDGRVYHLGIRAGEVANRIVTVGSPSRANLIAAYLDAAPKPFMLSSERGFITITGRYHGVPLSIVSIGMGHPNADFFVREVRECLSGDMVIIRLGSCGGLIDTPVGTVVVPKASVAVSRNYDYDFLNGSASVQPYLISKPVSADKDLHSALSAALTRTRPPTMDTPVLDDALNASADSFYASQGRQTSFPDHNAALVEQLQARHADLASLEMETFHILHLAASWRAAAPPALAHAPPVTTTPVHPTIAPAPAHAPSAQPPPVAAAPARIRAAAAQMVFAARRSRDFISPEEVQAVEAWAGRAVLETLAGFAIPSERLHAEEGSVWEVV